jgi:hypothetical protein
MVHICQDFFAKKSLFFAKLESRSRLWYKSIKIHVSGDALWNRFYSSTPVPGMVPGRWSWPVIF